ncbi:hypothetical protein [Legionella maceachernii]|uniref:hypothetical protein n=1 Tax=Legionella maceachernii TaxID=466 RepID=UPI000A757444|nr:hypothetical protein [Legionella maceachernii]
MKGKQWLDDTASLSGCEEKRMRILKYGLTIDAKKGDKNRWLHNTVSLPVY